MSTNSQDSVVIFEVVHRGPGNWRVSVNGADDAAPFPSNETATTAARVRARRLHLDTGVPAEVHAPNRSGNVECLIRYLRPDQLMDLCQSQGKWHAAFDSPLFETARGLS